jgi:membrane fusion protein, copper/silver efflux system
VALGGYFKIAALLVFAFEVGVWYTKSSQSGQSKALERRIVFYRDPMHPSYTSAKPGTAPDCGMQLEPVYADSFLTGKPVATTANGLSGNVRITLEKQQLMGIKVGLAEVTRGGQPIRSLGRVFVDETRLYRLNAATDGWIRQAPPLTIGSFVKRDQNLAVYYTRELRSAAQAYLYVIERLDHPKNVELAPALDLDQRGLEVAIETLRNLGMSDGQIHEMDRGLRPPLEVELRSPVTGFVLARNVSLGQRFNRGEELYRIADLSRVGILADLFENEAPLVQRGAPARVLVRHTGVVIHTSVGESLPQFDGVSRTLKVRLDVDNPRFALKPEMFVDVEFPVSLPSSLTAPVEAVVDSGRTKYVFIDVGNGYFEPRTVETGWHSGNRVQIVKGLAAGDKIVVSGNFLIDSETRMRDRAHETARTDGVAQP